MLSIGKKNNTLQAVVTNSTDLKLKLNIKIDAYLYF